MDDTRLGKSIGGGLVFSGEIDRQSLLKESVKDISKRLPVELDFNEYAEFSVYGDISFKELKDRGNVFYIPTTLKGKQGFISLNIEKRKKIYSLKLEIENSETKHFVEYKFKNENSLKFSLLIKKHSPVIILWVNGHVRAMKSLKRLKFAIVEPNIIIWNKFSEVYIKEACVWLNDANKRIIDEQRRVLTI